MFCECAVWSVEHRETSLEEGVVPYPANAAAGRFRVQTVFFCFRESNSVCADGSACPDPLLKEVSEKGGTCVKIVNKESVPGAQQLCVY